MVDMFPAASGLADAIEKDDSVGAVMLAVLGFVGAVVGNGTEVGIESVVFFVNNVVNIYALEFGLDGGELTVKRDLRRRGTKACFGVSSCLKQWIFHVWY